MGESFWERLRGLDRRELIGLVLVALLVVGAAALWYVRSLPGEVRVVSSAPGSAGEAGAAATRASPSPGVVVVHVAGWVHRPGVYELSEGDRGIDALRRAGGAKKDADLRSLNLAALLTDGQQIVVSKASRAMPAAVASGAPGGVAGTPTPVAELVNVNTATLDQLETLPGIGPALGQRIIDHREQYGPFASVEDLVDVSGIGEKTLEEIRPYVSV